jgi:hypothetical protein
VRLLHWYFLLSLQLHPSSKAIMVHTSAITAAAAALLLAVPCSAGLYSKNSPVLQVTGKSYDRLIAKSNYTSVSFQFRFRGLY